MIEPHRSAHARIPGPGSSDRTTAHAERQPHFRVPTHLLGKGEDKKE
ncbi:hypothetical protein [Streptomyces sp. NPDC059278]